jgi:hypothetical protein
LVFSTVAPDVALAAIVERSDKVPARLGDANVFEDAVNIFL